MNKIEFKRITKANGVLQNTAMNKKCAASLPKSLGHKAL